VRTYASVIHPEDSPTVDEVVAAAVAESRPYTVEYRVLRADGTSRWVTEHGRPHIRPDGFGAEWLDGVILPKTA
jgi:PAS domain S-box-containing protein